MHVQQTPCSGKEKFREEDNTMIQTVKANKEDDIVYVPLFGESAPKQLQGKFEIIKMHDTSKSDEELQKEIIQLIEEFFLINFSIPGEAFDFFELSSYIHKHLPNDVFSIVLFPKYGDDYKKFLKIKCKDNEIFFPCLKETEIEIVKYIPFILNDETQK